MSIKEHFEQTEKLYHFTSFDTALKIIESNRLRFGRLNNMNDIHENGKIPFADADNRPINEFPSDVLDALHDEIYKYRQISLTVDNKEEDKNGFDLHQMWGTYADKGDGVCLVFDRKELEKNFDIEHVHHERVVYEESKKLKTFIISKSLKPEDVVAEVETHVKDIFFHKRKEWEHEQEYRLLKRCPVAIREEYLLLGYSLRFVILSSKLRDFDEVLYFERIKNIIERLDKVEEMRKNGKSSKIPILIYGNGLFNYALCTEDERNVLWNSNEGYDVLVIGENCELAL
jgi:hypothetical protein